MNHEQLAHFYALGAHAGQKHGTRPYWKHLAETVDVLRRHNVTSGHLICAAWLHDTIEDTPTTYQDIATHFSLPVAKLVWAVTDELGRNRKERKEKTWPKTSQYMDTMILKLADLTANMEAAVRYNSKELAMYIKEWPATRERFVTAINSPVAKPMAMIHALDMLMDGRDA